MKTKPNPVAEPKGDACKLVSLLALAAGATAMPQTSNADIIYTDLTSAPVQIGFSGGAGSLFLINNLPGGASLRFFAGTHTGAGTFTSTRYVAVAGLPQGEVGVKQSPEGFAAVAGRDQLWNGIPGSVFTGAWICQSTFLGNHGPAVFNNKYLAFRFSDTTHGGRATFGWVNLSLGFGPVGPDVTIFEYAYDNAGEEIRMGAVPEPSPMALMALGALTLGASGVRSWRRNQAAASQP